MAVLPVEIITHVMSYLDDNSDLCSASLVSKTWCAASRDPSLRNEVDLVLHVPFVGYCRTISACSLSNVSKLSVLYAPHNTKFCVDVVPVSTTERKRKRTSSNVGKSNRATLFGINFKTLSLKLWNNFEWVVSIMEKAEGLQFLEIVCYENTNNEVEVMQDDRNIARISRALKDVTHMGLRSQIPFRESYLEFFFDNLSNLKHLSIHWPAFTKNNCRLLERICRKYPTILHFESYTISVFSESANLIQNLVRHPQINISHLYLEGPVELTANDLSWLRDMGLHLRKLSLTCTDTVTTSFFQTIIDTFRSLESLFLKMESNDVFTLSVVPEVEHVHVNDISGIDWEVDVNLKRNVNFKLSNIRIALRSPNEEIISNLFVTHPEITSASIQLGSNRPSAFLKVICQCCQLVRSLKASYNKTSKKRSTVEVDKALVLPMPFLRHLHLQCIDSLTDESLKSLVGESPDLRSMGVPLCLNVTDEGILAVMVNLKRLHTLNISGCRSLTGKCIDYIAEHSSALPRLTVIDASGMFSNLPQIISIKYTISGTLDNVGH